MAIIDAQEYLQVNVKLLKPVKPQVHVDMQFNLGLAS